LSQKRLRIQGATEIDAAILAEMGERTFRDTYLQINHPEDMEAYVSAHFEAKKVKLFL
jgi:hypothetical protein